MNFGTRTTRTCIAHFPEIIFFITVNDAVFGNIFFPHSSSFLVTRKSFARSSFKHGNIESIFVEFQYFGEVFPRPRNGFSFKIVAKRPVAQHFEHGVVVSVVSYFFQIVVFTAYTQTFLRIGNAWIDNRVIA